MTPSASLELLRTRALRFDDGWNAPLEDWTLRVKSHWTFDWPSETDPLLLSIAGHRFDPSSPLLVARDNGRYIVVDGARRLRAVRRIVGLDRRHPYRDWRWGLPPDECEARLRALRMLPCIVTDDLDAARRSALARHVAGNQWSWTVRKVCEGLAAEMERGEREADIESALGIPRAEVRLAALTALVMRRARETLGRQARRLDRGRWDTLRAVLGMQEVRFYLEMRRPMTWPVIVRGGRGDSARPSPQRPAARCGHEEWAGGADRGQPLGLLRGDGRSGRREVPRVAARPVRSQAPPDKQ